MKLSKICSATLLIFLISSCALDQMARKYDTVNAFTTTPEILETHGGKVNLKLNTEFEETILLQKATVEFTPVLVYEGGKKHLKALQFKEKMLQEEKQQFLKQLVEILITMMQ